MPLDPARTVADLKELRELTGDENGAQRVAWTDTWETAREWLRGKVSDTGAVEEIDEAGNQWFTLAGDSEQALLLGGHIDSVPNGGWLDGCLNVMAAVEVLRRIAEEGRPPLTVRVVNWADEEGARFGRSLFGSSAACGSMDDQDELRQKRDANGIALPDALAEHGVDLDNALAARKQMENAAAYLELHIEQGPGTRVDGHPARRRARHVRRRAPPRDVEGPGRARGLDADGQAARRAGAAQRSSRSRSGRSRPRSATAPCARRAASSASRASSRRSSRRRSSSWISGTSTRRSSRGCSSSRRRRASGSRARRTSTCRGTASGTSGRSCSTTALIELADESIREVSGTSHRLPSGPLHDAAEVARAGVPTVMVFVQSLRGLSHTKLEDTKEEHLELSVRALDGLASKVLRR